MKKRMIEKFDTPEETVAIAIKRFRPILNHWHVMDYCILTLLTSVYFQGFNDAIAVIAYHPETIPLPEFRDWQI